MLYRAKVLTNSQVLFIDYGNKDDVDDMYALSADLRQYTPLAYPVKLNISTAAVDAKTRIKIEQSNLKVRVHWFSMSFHVIKCHMSQLA